MPNSLGHKRIALQEMSTNTMTRLPPNVTLYRLLSSEMPRVVMPGKKLASKAEKKLRTFFKCTKFNLKMGHKSGVQCFATRHDQNKFKAHLTTRHYPNDLFYCCYCYPKTSYADTEIKAEDYLTAEDLVGHLLSVHKHRRFQCNLCLYRAVSPEHVTIHQKNIHLDIYESTQNNRQLDGKSCKIIECPSPAPKSTVGSAVQFFHDHKAQRCNRGNRNFQCVYCEYMNQFVDEVLVHCVHSHPDYPVLYYNPDTEVASNHSPPRTAAYQEVDLFGGNAETQVNRVSSTQPPSPAQDSNTREEPAFIKNFMDNRNQVNQYVAENSFQPKQKQRISNVQNISQKVASGLSHKTLNKDGLIRQRAGPQSKKNLWAAAAAMVRPNANPVGGFKLNKPMNSKTPMSTSMLQNRDVIKQRVEKKKYQSDDSDDEPSRPKSNHPSNRPAPSAGLPPLLSPHKSPKKEMICQKCQGNTRRFPEDNIGSHLAIYHSQLSSHKTKNNRIPFMCGYCKDFMDAETDASVVEHQMRCRHKPEGAVTLIDKLIISSEEHMKRSREERQSKAKEKSREWKLKANQTQTHKQQEQRNPKEDKQKDENSYKNSTPNSKPKIKPKKHTPIRLLSDNEQEEVHRETYGSDKNKMMKRGAEVGGRRPTKTSSSSDSDSDDQLKLRRPKPKEDKFGVLRKRRQEKQLRPMPKLEKQKRDKQRKKGYQSSGSESDDSDKRPKSPKASTSSMTLIERATPERDSDSVEEIEDQYVCLFCDKKFHHQEYKVCGEHLESHLNDTEEELEAHHQFKFIRRWGKSFVKYQRELCEWESDDPYERPHYRCPICVKIGKINYQTPRQFKRFYDLKVHLFKHIAWKSVKCLICPTDEDEEKKKKDLLNFDNLIAKHLQKCLEDIDEDWPEGSLSEQCLYQVDCVADPNSYEDFSEEVKQELVDKKIIEIQSNELMNKHIKQMLESIVEDYENQLRNHVYAQEDLKVTLPQVVVRPLPPLNFEDSQMIHKYMVDINEVVSTASAPSTSQSTPQPAKVERKRKSSVIMLDISDTSDEDNGNNEEVPSKKRKAPTLVNQEINGSEETEEEQTDEAMDVDDDRSDNIRNDETNHEYRREDDEDIDIDEVPDSEPEIVDVIKMVNKKQVEEQDMRSAPERPKESGQSSEAPKPLTPNSVSSGRYECHYCKAKFVIIKDMRAHCSGEHPDKPIYFQTIKRIGD